MSTQLQSGGNLRLPAQTDIRIDIRWEPERPAGREVDPSAFLLGADDRVGEDADFVFYNNPRARGDAVVLVAGSGARRQLRITPERLPDTVARVAICLSLFGGGAFAQVRRLEVRVGDAAGSEVAYFAPQTDGMSETALILGEVYRHREAWKFRALAQGFAGGLGPLASHFGVDIAEDESAEAVSTAAPTTPSAPSAPDLIKAPPTGALSTGSETEYSRLADLRYEILYRDAYALARVDLAAGRHLKAQSDAMIAMSPTLDVGSAMAGGLLGGLGRMIGGESLFLQTLTAQRGAGSVYFAPAVPGDIAAVELEAGEELVIQRGGFLACSEQVEVSTQMQNLAHGLFSGAGFFVLKARGAGLIFLEAFGAIHRLDLAPGEQRIVDNGHLVAWSQAMHYDLELGNRGLVAAFTSGENLVCRFRGPGMILIQSRRPTLFGSWIARFLPG